MCTVLLFAMSLLFFPLLSSPSTCRQIVLPLWGLVRVHEADTQTDQTLAKYILIMHTHTHIMRLCVVGSFVFPVCTSSPIRLTVKSLVVFLCVSHTVELLHGVVVQVV